MYLLNNNSITFLENQDIELLLDICDRCQNKMLESYSKFQNTREWLFTNMNWDDLSRFLMHGSTILHLYGWVPIKDCDFTIIPVEDKYDFDNELINKISNPPNYIELGYIGSPNWNPDWTFQNIELHKKLGVNSFEDLIINPRNYFYFQGVKMRNLDFEIIARFKRGQYRDQADIIMIDTLYPQLTEHLIEKKSTQNYIQYKLKNIKDLPENTIVINHYRDKVLEEIKKRYTIYILEKLYEYGYDIILFLENTEEYIPL